MIRLAVFLIALLGGCPAFAQSSHSLDLLNEANNTTIIPRYLLQDPNGRSITNEDFRGRFQLISFGYTYCPDVCPTTLVEMAEILKQLGEEAARVQPIFISVDPERDTGKILKTYTEFFDARILGLTSSPALVRRAADNFKIRYSKVREPGSDPDRYAVDHSAGMILLGPDGAFVKKFAFGMPVAEVTVQIRNFIKNY